MGRLLKIKYTFVNTMWNEFSTYVFTLAELKEGALQKVLSSGMLENGYLLYKVEPVEDGED